MLFSTWCNSGMASQAVIMGPLGIALYLLTFHCTKILLYLTSDFLWFTFSRFRAPGRQPDGVLVAYILMTRAPIFVKHVALQCEPLFLWSPNTYSHPLYGTFMSQLSQCIFECRWEDLRANATMPISNLPEEFSGSKRNDTLVCLCLTVTAYEPYGSQSRALHNFKIQRLFSCTPKLAK